MINKIPPQLLEKETPFFLFDKEILIKNYNAFKSALDFDTEICYAMKANSEKEVLIALNQLNSSFEVASKYELELLINIGISPDKMIYGSAVKPNEHIKYFIDYGVNRFAYDSEDELYKIAELAPKAKVYLRVLVDDKSESVFKMSEKFGVSNSKVEPMILKAKELGLDPYGISFNVGSQALNEKAWERGILEVIDHLLNLQNKGIKIQTLNLGGGFPFNYEDDNSFPILENIFKHINFSLTQLPYSLKIIMEPGRSLVANAYSLVANVIAKSERSNGKWVFIDVGVYNGLMESVSWQGNTKYKVTLLSNSKPANMEEYILTGPTGDNLDVINPKIYLPKNIKVGDKLLMENVGAYSLVFATKFNGFPLPETISL